MSRITTLEWSPGVPVTGENLEPVFLAALAAGDVEGVEHCIRLAVAVDPERAAKWWDELQFAVRCRGTSVGNPSLQDRAATEVTP